MVKLDVYPFENYLVREKDHLIASNNDPLSRNKAKPLYYFNGKVSKTPLEKLLSLRKRCLEEQCVQSVEAVMLVHLHRHPHVLLMKQRLPRSADEPHRIVPSGAANDIDYAYKLPGGRCRRGEKLEDCLMRKLTKQLLCSEDSSDECSSPMRSDTIVDVGGPTAAYSPFRVGELLGKWYRPHLNPLIYPYVPPHVSVEGVKEVRSIYLVHMDKSITFQCPYTNVELVPVPLFDLYDNAMKYGPHIVALPVAISRVLINYCSNADF